MADAAQVRPDQEPAPNYLPREEVEQVWSCSTPATEHEGARAWLASRGIDPALVFEAVRVLPERGWLPHWAHRLRRKGYVLIFPLRDDTGTLRGLRHRSLDPKAQPKAQSAQGYDVGGLVLSLGVIPPHCQSLVVVEGEPDWLTWLSLGHRAIGIMAGSWAQDRHNRLHGLRVPPGCRVYLRTDCNPAGDRYAHDIAATLSHAILYRLTGRDKVEDDNDHLKAGTLGVDPAASCVRIAAPPPSRPPRRNRGAAHRQEYRGQTSAYAQKALENEVEGLKPIQSDRRKSLYVAAYNLGQLVGAGEIDSKSVEDEIYDVATSSMQMKPSKARATIESGLKYGGRKPRIVPKRGFCNPHDLPSDAKASSSTPPAEPPPPKRTLADGREELDAVIPRCIELGGRHQIQGPCGLGKSHVLAHKVCRHLAGDRGDTLIEQGIWPGDAGWEAPDPDILGRRSATIAVPSRDNVEEMVALYEQVADPYGLTVAATPARTEKNCERFGLIALANNHAPDGGKLYCMGCPKHVRNSPNGETDCGFMHEMVGFGGADIQITTHAMELMREPMTSDRVFFDWSSIDAASMMGFPCRPWVKRTAGGYRVGVRQHASGTPVPAPVHTPYRAWTSESKLAMCEWMAEALDLPADWAEIKASVLDTDFEVRAEKAAIERAFKRARALGIWGEPDNDDAEDLASRPKTRVFVAWSKIAKFKGSQRSYVPTRHYQPMGWHKGWHLSVREVGRGETGAWLPPIEFTAARTREDASKGDFFGWLADAWSAPHLCFLSGIEDEARRRIDEWPVDVLVIDESMWPSMRRQGQLSVEDLARASAAQDIDGDIQPLSRALHQAACAAEQKGRRLSGPELGAIIGGLEVKGYSLGEQTVLAASRIKDGAVARQSLEGGVSWVGLSGLKQAVERGGRTAYVRDGVLHTLHRSTPTFEHARCVIGLDATTTPAIAGAIFGADVQFYEVAVDLPDAVEVHWIPYSTGKSSRVAGNEERPRGKRAGAIHAASILRYGAREGALNITHKDWLQGDGWVAKLAANEARAADWIYHGSGESRGSNRYKHAHTIRGDSYHVPRQAARADAELLGDMLGVTDWTEAIMSALDDEAQWQSVGAEVGQRYGRGRLFEATEDSPKCIVHVDDRDPDGLGLPTTDVIDPDVMAWEELGFVSHRVMDLVARAAVERAGGVYLPTVDIDGPSALRVADLRAAPHAAWWKRLIENRPEATTDDVRSTASGRVGDKLKRWVDKHFDGDWRAAAREWGVRVSFLSTDKGGRHIPVLHVGDVNPTRLELWVRLRGATSYRLDGGLRVTLPEVTSPLQVGLLALSMQPEAVDETLLVIGAATGRTDRTVRAWLSEQQRAGESVLACLQRLWIEVHAANAAAWLEEREVVLASQGVEDPRAVAVEQYESAAPWWIPWRAISAVLLPERETRQLRLW